jgi:branched-chain amino acid transport system ATP-binding protein
MSETSTSGTGSREEVLFRIEHLNAGYRGSLVLDDVSMRVREGESVALIGRNGVGKSTLVKTATGRLKPRGGNVFWKGLPITNWPGHKRVRAGLRWVDEDRGLFPNLTVRENLDVAGMSAPRSALYNRDEIMDLYPKLRQKSEQKAASLSGGEQRMLALARAVASKPDLLMLDEFSEGLQPSIVQELTDALRQANEDGLALVMVEQNVRLALRVATTAYIMDKGQIIYDGPTAPLREDDSLLRTHLVV